MADDVTNTVPGGYLTPRFKHKDLVSARYPWSEWTNGRVWRLTKDEDFVEAKPLFQTYCHYMAKVYGLRAVTRSESKNVLLVQFTEPEVDVF
jgi:hypothetical protein